MNCPVCQKELDFTITDKCFTYTCTCNSPQNNTGVTLSTFHCVVEIESNKMSAYSFNMMTKDILFIYNTNLNPLWTLSISTDLLASGNNIISPEESFTLIKRYQKLLAFS